jgi:hypothetical protein
MHPILKPGLLAFVAFTAACGGSSTPGDGSSSATSGSTPPAASGTAASVDIEAIFPPGPGRELLLNNCQNCHTFVPIVVLQMDKDAWNRNALDHRERVTTLSDEEFKTLYEYLAANFNPTRPVPELPKELLESWTSY